MEAFSLLKYWKATPPSSAVAQNGTETDADDGPFFDLELALPDEEEQDDAIQDKNDNDEDNSDSDSESESEKEFKFTLSPSASSNDLIFKGNLVLNSSQPNSNSNSKPQFTASLLKSATKLRVFMLGLKKPKTKPKAEPDNKEPKNPRQRKLFTVKFKVEEVPIVSLFTRDNSSRAKPNTEESESESESESSHTETEIVSSGSDEKRLMRKYLKMVKPLYVRVSRRYAEKVDVSSPESGKAATPPAEDSETAGIANVKAQKQGNVALPAGLRKHLGKGRSAAAAAEAAAASSKRRDDSLLQQQDWIQGAILHCKRSFNASTECESSQLPRSVSDPLRETSPELSENSTSEDNDKCL